MLLIFGLLAGAILGLLMLAEDLVRMCVSRVYTHPLIPEGVTFVVSDRFINAMGVAKYVGGARAPAAVALGRTVVVESDIQYWSAPAVERLVKHELVHAVTQRNRYGRFFLLVYVALFVRHGFNYTNHPLEVEARAGERV
jgi:hypothetical protein